MEVRSLGKDNNLSSALQFSGTAVLSCLSEEGRQRRSFLILTLAMRKQRLGKIPSCRAFDALPKGVLVLVVRPGAVTRLSHYMNLAVPVFLIIKYQKRNLKSIIPPSPQAVAFLK